MLQAGSPVHYHVQRSGCLSGGREHKEPAVRPHFILCLVGATVYFKQRLRSSGMKIQPHSGRHEFLVWRKEENLLAITTPCWPITALAGNLPGWTWAWETLDVDLGATRSFRHISDRMTVRRKPRRTRHVTCNLRCLSIGQRHDPQALPWRLCVKHELPIRRPIQGKNPVGRT